MMDRRFTPRWRLVAGVLAVVVAFALVAGGAVSLWRGLNPFGTDTVDRSQPALLQSIRDISEYHAAVGDFQVVVDVEKDVKLVPAALAGERTLFVAAGTVDAFVDFSGLKGDALTVSPDGKSVQVRLPAAQLGKPNLDQERSYVFAQQRGAFNRLSELVGAPTDQHQVYVLAEQKITEAAGKSKLASQAQDNTRAMLTGLLQSLGFQVSFADAS